MTSLTVLKSSNDASLNSKLNVFSIEIAKYKTPIEVKPKSPLKSLSSEQVSSTSGVLVFASLINSLSCLNTSSYLRIISISFLATLLATIA